MLLPADGRVKLIDTILKIADFLFVEIELFIK